MASPTLNLNELVLADGPEFIITNVDEDTTSLFSDRLLEGLPPTTTTSKGKEKEKESDRRRFIGLCRVQDRQSPEKALQESIPILKYCETRSEIDVIRIFALIIRALASLHERHIVHGGICASNVLLANEDVEDLNAWIIMDRKVSGNLFESQVVEYRSPEHPELDKHEKTMTTKCDVYALGILMQQVIIESRKHLISLKLKRTGVRKDARLEKPYGLSPAFEALWDLGSSCAKRSASTRPAISEVETTLAKLLAELTGVPVVKTRSYNSEGERKSGFLPVPPRWQPGTTACE